MLKASQHSARGVIACLANISRCYWNYVLSSIGKRYVLLASEKILIAVAVGSELEAMKRDAQSFPIMI